PRGCPGRPAGRARAGPWGLVLLLALLALPAARGTAAEAGGDGEIAVAEELRGDPRVGDLAARIGAAWIEAHRSLRSRFGLRPGRLPVAWRITGRLPAPPGDAGDAGRFAAGRIRFEGDRVLVEIPGPRYLARPSRAGAVVLHEAAHALLASRRGSRRRYEEIPPWFREGLALLASREGDSRLHARIAVTVLAGRPPASFLRGLGAESGGGRARRPSPAESYLAVDLLALALGESRFGVLVERLAEREDLERLLGEEWRGGAAGFRRDFAAAAVGRVDALAPPGAIDDLRRAVRLLEAGEPAEARVRLGRLIDGESAPALTATARYFRARSLLEEGRPGDAAGDLEALLAPPVEGLWEPEGLIALGRCLAARGRRDEAARLWEEVCERFAEDLQSVARARALLSPDGEP
ncbi:MAG: hypothetical protein JXA90_02575, partial [Planctomycetes bacterium]|nr:hypothetical protein [Planctomycetota bacterium]